MVEEFCRLLCDCLELPFTHVHCPCVKCCGKATARRVELRHWKNKHALHESDTDLHSEKREKNASIQDNAVDNLLQLGTDEECSMSFCSDLGNNEMDSSSDPYDRCESQLSPDSEQSFAGSELLNASMPNLVSGEDNERVDDSDVSESETESNSKNEASQLKELIADAVIDAMKIVDNYGSSTKEFEYVLSLGKKLLANNISNIDNDLVEVLWPNNWQQAQEILASAGYKGAHQYYVCFCKEERKFKKDGITLKKTVYNGNWDVMHEKNTPCKHCGMPGKITFYYLGLHCKVINWFKSESICKKLLAHWLQRDHWLGRNCSWPLKKEIWDGKKWLELQWFGILTQHGLYHSNVTAVTKLFLQNIYRILQVPDQKVSFLLSVLNVSTFLNISQFTLLAHHSTLLLWVTGMVFNLLVQVIEGVVQLKSPLQTC